ncbi:hypothetical protein [Corynebacterium coyleae]|uniref:hypothetical protein n=1 Tax=Corynebacterium coyleae TaxID=53374 RepID=UPI000C75C151|nr:hypothetical protein [Corynebacterium coyleae]PLA28127.1 hypothetical protein CYJ45_04020 [Corynebacterium coyleae]
METRSVLWIYAIAAVAFPAAWISLLRVIGDGWEFRTVTAAFGILEAATTLFALGGAVWFTATARGRNTTGVLVTVWIAAACLVVGWGSMAVAHWEEYQADMALPIINLFMFLIPIGTVLVFAAAIAETASRARSKRQR